MSHAAIDRHAKGSPSERRIRVARSRPQRGGGHHDPVQRLRDLAYVRQAPTLEAPLPVTEPAIPVTVKLSGDVARRLRAHAASSGLTQGEIVRRALEAFIAQARDRA
jgi:Ribbon-helix-helix protein, copG family